VFIGIGEVCFFKLLVRWIEGEVGIGGFGIDFGGVVGGGSFCLEFGKCIGFVNSSHKKGIGIDPEGGRYFICEGSVNAETETVVKYAIVEEFEVGHLGESVSFDYVRE